MAGTSRGNHDVMHSHEAVRILSELAIASGTREAGDREVDKN